jgi:16S rRNA (cytosine1402-N4)-methyltransferase
MQHITVLKAEAVEGLALHPGSIVIDATLGAGGHAQAILNQLDSTSTFVGIDADVTSITSLSELTTNSPATVHLVVANFSQLHRVLDNLHITEATAILADLGWRSDQFTTGNKGFSFGAEEPLLMTYGDPADYAFTAHDIVNTWAEGDIANVVYAYGEERYSRRIAKAIVEARYKHTISTAKELATIIENSVPGSYKNGRTHAATKSFQGLRIAVNDEFAVLETFLAAAWTRLSAGGRLAVISFHSLEDRIVKHTFKQFAQDKAGLILTKKPIIASRAEVLSNPRARSAKLRIIQKA